MKRYRGGLMVTVMIFISFTVQGQEAPQNVIAGGINFSDEFPYSQIIVRPGLSIEYERLLNNQFSVGGDMGTNVSSWPYGEVQGRWYPWTKKFFAGLGVGTICIWGSHPGYSNFLFPVFSPEIGWKIDIGKAQKGVIILSLTDRINFRPLYTNMLELCFKIGKKF